MIYNSWDIEHDRLKLVIIGHSLPFYPPPLPPPLKNLKNQNFEKLKKIAGDIIILHVYQKPQSYEVWFQRYGVRHRIFCHFGPIFSLMNNVSGDVIILDMCTKNHTHIMCAF